MTSLSLRTQEHQADVPSGIAPRSRARAVALWTTQLTLAVVFVLAGIAKLAGAADMVRLFDAIGIGQWLRYVTGSIEIVSAIFLLIPSFAVVGAVALALTMIGTIVAHIGLIGGNLTAPAVLLAATTFVAWTRRSPRYPEE